MKALVLLLVTSALAVSAPAPRKANDRVSWTGKLIMLKHGSIEIVMPDEQGDPKVVAQLSSMVYRVLEEHDGRLRVRQRNKEGWFDKNNAVLLDDAPAYFSERIDEDKEKEDASPYAYRGTAWQMLGKLDLAIKDYDEAIRLNPSSAWYNNRAIIHSQLKNMEAAFKDLTEAIRQNPDDPVPYINRARVHSAKKNLDDALKDLDQAVELDGDDPGVFLARGHLHDQRREQGQALSDFERVNKLDPKNSSALNGRAWIMATSPEPKLRDGKYAVELARKACEITEWKDANIVDTLAAACAEVGLFEDAVRFQEQAMQDAVFTQVAGERARRRLQLYMKKMPFRDEDPE